VAWAKDGAKDKTGAMGLTALFRDRKTAGWTMNKTTGTARRTESVGTRQEVETCAFCHARRGVLHEGYVPGRPISDTHRVSLLDEGLYYADGQIRDEVYEYGSFRQSKMYRAGVTCSDCHDPHTGRHRKEGNALCGQCHKQDKFDSPEHHHHVQGSKGTQCVSCHMMQRDYMVVDPRRDHSFRTPRPDLSVKLGTPNTCNDCHADKDARWAEEAFFKWYGTKDRPHYGEVLHAARNNLSSAGDSLARLVRDPNTPGIVRATAVAHLASYLSPSLIPVLKQALQDADPQVREAVVTAVMPLEPVQRLSILDSLLADPVRAVRIEAGRALAAVPAQEMKEEQRTARDRAVEAYRQAQQTNADRPEAWLNLGNLDMETGNAGQAERDYRTALELDPNWEPAIANFADLLRAGGRDEEGERLLRDGIKRLPNAAGLHHALGLLEVRRKNLPASLPSLKRAVELDPRNARYGYVYAVALLETGRRPEALAVTEATLGLTPNDRALRGLRTQLSTAGQGASPAAGNRR
jgi:predicted CXXCH cytochrome family protein